MKFRIAGFEDTKIEDSYNSVLIIKDHKLFSKVLFEIKNYCSDYENNTIVILDDKNNYIKGNQIEFIIDPFHINLNSKQNIQKLYKTIETNLLYKQDINTKYLENINAIQSIILDELDEYDLDFMYCDNIVISAFLKSMELKINEEKYENIFDKIIDYIEIVSNFFPNKLFIFGNMLKYFSIDEVRELDKYINYNKLYCMFIENELNEDIRFLKKHLIDDDFCEEMD